jgi:stress-induced morphogen
MEAELVQAVPMKQRLEDKLRASLKIEHLVSCSYWLERNADEQDIVDTSGNCGSSFACTIVSPDFAKKMTLARHKMSELPQAWSIGHS